MVEKCETECETTGGAIFCDGQFLNASNLDACVDELAAEISIDLSLDIDANLDVDIDDPDECDSDPCDEDDTVDEIGDEVDEACSVANVGSGSGGGALALFGLSLLGVAWRARKRSATPRS
jgi:hypothetical protein